MFETVAEQWRAWTSHGLELELAVNLGTHDVLDLTLPDEIEDLLERHRVPPRNLILEITERTLIADERRAARVVDRLTGLGVRVALDDFGIGYSSLARLRRFHVDQIKLDRSLVAGAADDPAAQAILRGSVEIAHGLGSAVVAEGVETASEWDFVVQAGCDMAQGYLIGRALPGDGLVAFVQSDPAVTPQLVAA